MMSSDVGGRAQIRNRRRITRSTNSSRSRRIPLCSRLWSRAPEVVGSSPLTWLNSVGPSPAGLAAFASGRAAPSSSSPPAVAGAAPSSARAAPSSSSAWAAPPSSSAPSAWRASAGAAPSSSGAEAMSRPSAAPAAAGTAAAAAAGTSGIGQRLSGLPGNGFCPGGDGWRVPRGTTGASAVGIQMHFAGRTSTEKTMGSGGGATESTGTARGAL